MHQLLLSLTFATSIAALSAEDVYHEDFVDGGELYKNEDRIDEISLGWRVLLHG